MNLWWALPVAIALFLAVCICSRLGWRLGRKRAQRLGEDSNEGLGAVDAAIFGLMGLLIAFTFTGAASRFDQRRDLIRDEVNAMGTAWMRLDLISPPARAQLQHLMRDYVDERIATHRNIADMPATLGALQRSMQLQAQIWSGLQQAVRDEPAVPIAQTVLPAFNDMFDAATTRVLAARQHPPPAIYFALLLLVLASALLSGFGQARAHQQSLVHLFGFAAVTTFALCLIVDLEYPRLGLIRVGGFDQALIDLRAGMN